MKKIPVTSKIPIAPKNKPGKLYKSNIAKIDLALDSQDVER